MDYCRSRNIMTAILLTLLGSVAAAGAAARYGYWLGGTSGTTAATSTSKINFSNDSYTATGSTLTYAQAHGAGLSGTTTGYIAGGEGTSSAFTNADKLQKVTFSTGATATAGAFATAFTRAVGTESSTNGYVAAGNITNTTTGTTAIRKVAFSDDTKSTLSATSTGNRTRQYGTSRSSTDGYFIGGASENSASTAGLTNIDKLIFSNETISNLAAAISAGVGSTYSANAVTKSYTFGGRNSSSANITTISTLTYSTDTYANVSATVTAERYHHAVSGPDFCYVGPYSTAPASSPATDIRKFTYSSETFGSSVGTAPTNKYVSATVSG
jgi:hypothetical protein